MNVLIVTDVYHPDTIGGAGRVAAELARCLAARGHAVKVISRATRRATTALEVRDGVTIHRYPVDARNPVAFISQTRSGIASQLDIALDGFTPDVLDLHQPLSALRAMAAPALRGVPAAYTFHSSWTDELRVRGGWRRWLAPVAAPIEKSALTAARALVVLSEYSRRRVSAIAPGMPTIIIPGGVDLEAFPVKTATPAHVVPVLLTIRNLVPRMGLDILIAAAKRLAEEGEEFELRIGGSGPLLAQLRADARPLGSRVKFLGRIPEDDLSGAYRDADLFILPTAAIEGFGLVILEAFSSGTPVVGTPVGAIAELAGLQGHGYVAAAATPEAIADALREMLARHRNGRGRVTDGELITPANLRALAERYSWSRRAGAVEALYKKLMTSSPHLP